MKKAVIALLGLLAVASAVWAQTSGTNTVSRNGYYFNSTTGQKTDADGNAYVNEASKDRDNWTLIASFADTVNSGTGLGVRQYAQLAWTAESTTVAACYQYRRMWLALRVVPAGGDTAFKTYLAVQVRAHTTVAADSNSTFAWYGWATSAGSAATVADSLGQFFKGTHPDQGSGLPQVAGPGEKLFVFQPGAGYGGILSQGAIFSWPNGVWVPLVDQRGSWFGAPYVSIRARMLWGTGPVRVICQLYGAS